jgi:hypothetical protein
MRDPGAVLDHEEPRPIRHAIKCSSSQYHQRGGGVRRRNGRRETKRLPS